MKRIALFVVLGCAVACLAGCDEVKRRAGKLPMAKSRAPPTSSITKARDAARNAADSSIDKATGDDAAAADKRKKLKGGDEDDK